MKHPFRAVILAASATLALGGCVTDDYGYGGGSVAVGYGGGGYYGDPYWGWYDDYYYPGTGYYIYDRGGGRHAWNDSQRRYWEGRRGNRPGSANWSGFRRDGNSGTPGWRGREDQQQGLTDSQRQQRREAWQAQRGQSGQSGLSDADRQARREAWRAQRQQMGQPSGQANDAVGQARREAWQAQRQQQSAQPSAQPAQPRFERQGGGGGSPGWRGRGGRDRQ